jgi:hypothetical protein
MTAATARRPYVLLTRLFLRQFLENDLIAPEADRSQLLAVVGAMVLSLMLFLSVMLSMNYVMGMKTPGQAAVLSLNDKFLYMGLAMIVTALVAAAQWDALTIDLRDAAILEPLPVPAGTIRQAKLSAVAILGAGVAVAVNAAPSLVFPWLLVFSFRDLSVLAMFGLMITHAVVGIAAAAFGYLAVIACRESMAAVLGPRRFRRVSPWAQGALITILGGSLLLLPSAANDIARRGFDGWRASTPPMWFLGAYELAAGGVIADLPRAPMKSWQAENDDRATQLYRQRRGRFPALARQAAWACGLVFLLAMAGYLRNTRRLPSLAVAAPPPSRRRWRSVAGAANTWLLRDPPARAGFYFALAAMWRSNTHRLTLACAAAAGLAMAIVALTNANLGEGTVVSPRLLSMQPLLYGALLVGFRHVIRIPAELRANWGFQLAWRGHARAFLFGVKCAAIFALAIPAIAALLVFFGSVLGVRLALLHALIGLAGAIVLLDALMLSYDKVPFTCTYLPSENMKALVPIYALAFLIGASMFARMQYDALHGAGAMALVTTLAVLFAVIRVASVRRARLPSIEFDEAPTTFLRLGLDA